jgi:hypothetical protein
MNLIGKIGLAIGILGGVLGLGVGIMAAPVMGSIMAVIFIGVFGGVYWAFFRPMQQQGKLLQSGVPASGVITRIWDTGVTINNNPEIGIEVQVTPSTGMPFTAKAKSVISRLQTSYYQPGMACTVRYDPNDTSKVAIESLGSSSGTSSAGTGYGNVGYSQQQTQQIQDELMKQDALNQQIMSYGTSAKAVILSYQDMNIKVNGNNPAVTLEVEVTPDDRPSFKATVKGVIQDTSVPKYQPGREVYVKYDPNDLTKVTMDHS